MTVWDQGMGLAAKTSSMARGEFPPLTARLNMPLELTARCAVSTTKCAAA